MKIGFTGIFITSCLYFLPYSAFSSGNYSKIVRTDELKHTFQSFNKLSTKELNDIKSTLKTLIKVQCQSSISSLKLSCIEDLTKKYCQQRFGQTKRSDCLRVSDVMIVNLLNEEFFLPARERYEFLKRKVNTQSLTDHISRKQAALTIQFAESNLPICKTLNGECLAEAIDEFCISRSDQINLSWQACASSLAWSVWSTRSRPEKE